MRCILGMAETVVTGCADGYARMAGKPAATLLHCGPGFANGIANVHNARRAFTPMVNIVGDHATYHRPFDAPLTADTEGLARAVSHWVRTSASAGGGRRRRRGRGAGREHAARADRDADPAGRHAPGTKAARSARRCRCRRAPRCAPDTVRDDRAGAAQRSSRRCWCCPAQALSEAGLRAANRVAHATGAKLRTPTQVSRMARGRGRVPVDRIPYVVDGALKVLAGTKHVILVGAKPPTAFFAYPGKPSLTLSPPDCDTHVLARPEQDASPRCEALADELGAPKTCRSRDDVDQAASSHGGKFEPEAFACTLAALLPENCIVAEDAVTSGRALFAPTFGAAPHDWLQITGGAIGHAFPLRHRRRDRLPGPQGRVPAGRRRRHVLAAGAVDAGAREARRGQRGVRQPHLQDPARRTAAGGRASPAAPRTSCSTSRAPNSTGRSSPAAWAWRRRAWTRWRRFADVFKSACGRRGPFLIEFRI